MKTNIDYWDKFYSGVDLKLKIPSQFAAFVAMEYLDKVNTILDIGCGNGRDSVFFSSLGFRVIGIDASKKALEQIKKNSFLNAKFFVGDISDKTLRDILEKNISSEGKNLIYSRFFLHAISDKIEEDFWNLANSLTSKGDFMALEFRNEKDEKGNMSGTFNSGYLALKNNIPLFVLTPSSVDNSLGNKNLIDLGGIEITPDNAIEKIKEHLSKTVLKENKDSQTNFNFD